MGDKPRVVRLECVSLAELLKRSRLSGLLRTSSLYREVRAIENIAR
jgi:hypothetical protein